MQRAEWQRQEQYPLSSVLDPVGDEGGRKEPRSLRYGPRSHHGRLQLSRGMAAQERVQSFELDLIQNPHDQLGGPGKLAGEPMTLQSRARQIAKGLALVLTWYA